MINSAALLTDLRRFLRTLDDDLRARINEQDSLRESLKAEWTNAREAGRTGVAYTEWFDDEITQAAVHWVLGCVYLRFLEDNHYLERPYLAGPNQEQLALARDRHEQYFRAHPTESDRDYLLYCFRDVAQLPGMRGLFDERHNPVFRIGLSGDGAMQLLGFWQKVNPDSGLLIHDFSDSESATRFLGDLYQDLSEPSRKRYALLQTPIFVEEFILDRALTPAIDEFGYQEVRLIDPTCGSGHFLLGAFQRLFNLWARNEPARNLGDLAQRALDGVYGVDLNPYAVAIARFRLLIASLKVCDVTRLRDAPAFRVNVATGDSLLHGRRFNQLDLGGEAELLARNGLAHAYMIEDLGDVDRILGQQYHTVVGNPPYITVKDAALNAAYRARYVTCHMKYSLGVPFTERFFDLAINGDMRRQAGFVGMITANSFMKREFGSKLIEEYLPSVELTHVIDASGAYIPGHGTPTVILFGRNRRPVSDTVRTVMGIKGEPTTPDDPARGQVWQAIISQVDRAGSESAFVSVADMLRTIFGRHPWSIGGGGAAELKEEIENRATGRLQKHIAHIGFMAITGEDDSFVLPTHVARRVGFPFRPFVLGDMIRDWCCGSGDVVLFPYLRVGGGYEPAAIAPSSAYARRVWRVRTTLKNRSMFGKTIEEHGFRWDQYMQFIRDRVSSPLLIAYAEVASHNHFILSRGGKVFKQTAPVIMLKNTASEDDHFALHSLLNSSVACFWMKQVSHQKQMTGGDGIRVESRAKVPYQFSGTQLGNLPLPADWDISPMRQRLANLGRQADSAVRTLEGLTAWQAIEQGAIDSGSCRTLWREIQDQRSRLRSKLILLQEEVDFICYAFYGLADAQLLDTSDSCWDVDLQAGDRPFCLLAQHNEDGFAVPLEVPEHWPDGLKVLWRIRMSAVRNSEYLRIVEDPHYKRRWIGRQGVFNHTASGDEFAMVCAEWLKDRLEDARYWSGDSQLKSVSRLADLARADTDFLRVAELYSGRSDFDVTALVNELVASESVPFLPKLRYSESGLRKREQWEITWALQRKEDAINIQVELELKPSAGESAQQFKARLTGEQRSRTLAEVKDIPAPPKYQSKDFLKSDFWRMRGGLDVPRERFIIYPHCSRDADGSVVVAWAGWDHLQQATAIASYYLSMKENEGWSPERLKPLLTGLQELLPWLKQWHNEYSFEHATRMGEYFESFVADEARTLGYTHADLRAWTPSVNATASQSKKKKAPVP